VGGRPLSVIDPLGLDPNQMCVAACTAIGISLGGAVGEIGGGIIGGALGGALGTAGGPAGTALGGGAGAAWGAAIGGAAGAGAGAGAGAQRATRWVSQCVPTSRNATELTSSSCWRRTLRTPSNTREIGVRFRPRAMTFASAKMAQFALLELACAVRRRISGIEDAANPWANIDLRQQGKR
jgi:hypothetical protein